mgnify:CR=1 FL=1
MQKLGKVASSHSTFVSQPFYAEPLRLLPIRGLWITLSIRLKLLPFLLVVTLIIVAGSSIRTAYANIEITLNSRQYDGATENLGQMLLDGQGPYNLPYGTRVPAGDHKILFIPPAGFYWAALDVDGYRCFWRGSPPLGRPEAEDFSLSGDDPTITALYNRIGISVGGVVVPLNKLAVLSPYLALLGLVGAVTVAVALQRREP